MNDFLKVIVNNAEKVLDYLPVDYDGAVVAVKPIVKNNGVTYTGLMVQKPGEKIAPIVNLEYVAENSNFLREALEMAARMVINNAADTETSICENNIASHMDDYETVKTHIFPRVASTSLNKERLAGMPHREIADGLSLYYAIDVSRNGTFGEASAKITNEMLVMWGNSVTEEELFEVAIKNMYRNKDSAPIVEPVEEMLGSVMGPAQKTPHSLQEYLDGDIESEIGMYILTSKSLVFGAGHLADDRILKALYSKIGPYYVLPSSVHEILFLPYNQFLHPEDLVSVVREVNNTEVDPDEVLSDDVYLYNGEKLLDI